MKKSELAYWIGANAGISIISVLISTFLILSIAPTLYTELFILGFFLIPMAAAFASTVVTGVFSGMGVVRQYWHGTPAIILSIFLSLGTIGLVQDHLRFPDKQEAAKDRDPEHGFHVDAEDLGAEYMGKLPDGFGMEHIEDIQVTTDHTRKYWFRFEKVYLLKSNEVSLAYYDWMWDRFSAVKTDDQLIDDLTAFEHLSKKPKGTIEWQLAKDSFVFNTKDKVHYLVHLKPDGNQISIDHVDVQ
ncbi:hypothetical protein [Tumebacillus flagellatus]|uniref:Uncharacterized protein n=1 Tax=Tumebacillus flagellatus TaxID=1157490 RepID=A0A074MH95_9BACL|nr:hypothetical protein [Tumebacillus flagellatus]KEO85057.1 hypothetical protein EL26_00385 [Tumebacillus flagellatus]